MKKIAAVRGLRDWYLTTPNKHVMSEAIADALAHTELLVRRGYFS
jgi:hypothetical protein